MALSGALPAQPRASSARELPRGADPDGQRPGAIEVDPRLGCDRRKRDAQGDRFANREVKEAHPGLALHREIAGFEGERGREKPGECGRDGEARGRLADESARSRRVELRIEERNPKLEMLAQGDSADVDDCIRDLEESFAGYIRETKIEDVPFSPQLKNFRITY